MIKLQYRHFILKNIYEVNLKKKKRLSQWTVHQESGTCAHAAYFSAQI